MPIDSNDKVFKIYSTLFKRTSLIPFPDKFAQKCYFLQFSMKKSSASYLSSMLTLNLHSVEMDSHK